MRWVCKDDIEECLTEAWRTQASEVLESVSGVVSQDDRKAILRNVASTTVWRNYYRLLPENLKKKCWYCESEKIRSDMPVDHFRPKGKVDGDSEHEGYWWLAYDWENYRCACTLCNSRRILENTDGGKACKFPLIDPHARAYLPSDEISGEIPAFLDPFDPDDFKLLWFDNDGIPEASSGCTEEQQKKVDNSIDIFHLHEQGISRKRNKIRIDIKRQIEILQNGGTADVRKAKSYLRKIIRDTEMLSRAACVYLSNYRYIPAIKEILNSD